MAYFNQTLCVMKIFNVFFILLFILSAAVQYNDPDPLIWMAIYLYGATLCYLAIKKKYNSLWYFPALAFYGFYAAYLFFSETGVLSWIISHNSESIVQTMKATKPWIEETREFFGLMLLIFVLLVNLVVLRKERRKMYVSVTGELRTEI